MNKFIDWKPRAFTGSGAIEVCDVHLNVAGRRVLQDISFRAQPGRLLVLVGPNGAGKSSLLDVMAGLRLPSLGDVLLDGQAISSWPPAQLARRRAMLSQKVQLGFGFRVEDVVMLGRSSSGRCSFDEIDHATVRASLTAVNATHLYGRNYLELSGGEQQRVQLARVLAQVWDQQGGPSWLLLDEPEAGLDIAHQHHVLTHARALAARGYGVVAVLHDLNLAQRYADDVGVLACGRLVRFGSPTHALDADVLSEIYGIALQRGEVGNSLRSSVIFPAANL